MSGFNLLLTSVAYSSVYCHTAPPTAEFREKKGVTGDAREAALWLAVMELQRLETWVPTKRGFDASDDFEVKL